MMMELTCWARACSPSRRLPPCCESRYYRSQLECPPPLLPACLPACPCPCPPQDLKPFDPFEILGVEPGATTPEIKKAYRSMSLLYHPDKVGEGTRGKRGVGVFWRGGGGELQGGEGRCMRGQVCVCKSPTSPLRPQPNYSTPTRPVPFILVSIRVAIPAVTHPRPRPALLPQNPDKKAHAYFAEYITKAYQALTDEAARKNYEKYGHPDGPQVGGVGVFLGGGGTRVNMEEGRWTGAVGGRARYERGSQSAAVSSRAGLQSPLQTQTLRPCPLPPPPSRPWTWVWRCPPGCSPRTRAWRR